MNRAVVRQTAVVAFSVTLGAAFTWSIATAWTHDIGHLAAESVHVQAGQEPREYDGITTVLQHTGAPDPLAVRTCRALHGAPAAARASCCHDGDAARAPAVVGDIERTCVQTLSALLAGGAATLTDHRVAACEAAQSEALDGCGWVRPLAPNTPTACTGLVQGALDSGARCRSSLECGDGLRCHGASALDVGRCGAPRPDGAPCGTALDAMALAFGTDAIDQDHAECEGRCVLGRCTSANLAAFAPQKPLPLSIRAGARAVAEGGRCTNDLQCLRGGCVKEPGAAFADEGVCAMKCSL